MKVIGNNVCNLFCFYNNITLNGCTECISFDKSIAQHQVKEILSESGASLTTSTTPNWDEVCITLCKQGDGGVLCNCDLPPLL